MYNKTYCYDLLGSKLSVSLSEVDHQRIDEINILQASLLSMKNAYENICFDQGAIVLIDGNQTFPCSNPHHELIPVVKGDQKSSLIGLASIIAKTKRDHDMQRMDKIYPGYGFAKHAGYPTKAHREAIIKIGPAPIHRKTFKGVREFL